MFISKLLLRHEYWLSLLLPCRKSTKIPCSNSLLYSFMKRILFIVLCQVSFTCFAQTYISLAPSLSNNAGTFGEKANFAFEVGRQWDVFSLGVDYGRATVGREKGKESANHLDLRPSLTDF